VCAHRPRIDFSPCFLWGSDCSQRGGDAGTPNINERETDMTNEDALPSPSSRLKTAAPAFGLALLLTGLIWLAAFQVLPPLDGMEAVLDRLVFALKCVCAVCVFTLLTAVEAVSHERLTSAAFDPLAGQESRRLKVNLRYLQNTLEQVVLFVPGVFTLAVYCDSGSSMRSVVAASFVWALARVAFWIGYHLGPQHRVSGLVGVMQSMLVLLYVTARFGFEVAGAIGAAAPIILFVCAEIVLVRETRRLPSQAQPLV
jgi:hypothetical protein